MQSLCRQLHHMPVHCLTAQTMNITGTMQAQGSCTKSKCCGVGQALWPVSCTTSMLAHLESIDSIVHSTLHIVQHAFCSAAQHYA